jgi:hypothetical protein
MLALTGAGALHAQRGRSVGCDKILNPNKVESFVQRFSCASMAMDDEDDARAFDLMAPIYKDAISSKSNTRVDTQAKLRKIVELKLGDATDQLVGQYGADSVYAAIADASGINPITGKETKGASKVVLPAELVTAVADAIGARGPAAPAEEVGIPEALPLTPEEMAIVEKVTPQERQQAAQEVTDANIKLFALNSVLDQMFTTALIKDDQEVCQNLIAGVCTGQSLAVIRNAAKAKTNDEMYYTLKQGMTSGWTLFEWFKSNPSKMSQRQLLEAWTDIALAPVLADELSKAGIPSESDIEAARAYLTGKTEGSASLRLSKAFMLAREAVKFIYEPLVIEGRATRRATVVEARYVPVQDIYNTLIGGILKRNFRLTSTTTFKIEIRQYQDGRIIGSRLEERTLDELDKYLGEFIAIQMADVLLAQATPEQRRTWRDTAIRAAKIGGVLAVVAAVVYAGHTGYLGERVQKLATPIVTTFVGGMGYVGAAASYAASKGAAGARYVGGALAGAASYIPGSSYIASAAKYSANAVWGLGKSMAFSGLMTGAVGLVGSMWGRMTGAAPVAAAQPAAVLELSPLPSAPMAPMGELREGVLPLEEVRIDEPAESFGVYGSH